VIEKQWVFLAYEHGPVWISACNNHVLVFMYGLVAPRHKCTS
jgi:hypothetical protein